VSRCVDDVAGAGFGCEEAGFADVRKWFAGQKVDDYITRCMELAGLQKIYMTNSPFDDLERPTWEKGFKRDSRFTACLRIDPLFLVVAGGGAEVAEVGLQNGHGDAGAEVL